MLLQSGQYLFAGRSVRSPQIRPANAVLEPIPGPPVGDGPVIAADLDVLTEEGPLVQELADILLGSDFRAVSGPAPAERLLQRELALNPAKIQVVATACLYQQVHRHRFDGGLVVPGGILLS